jgi:NDP-sugar pyrophosphorylase family protein
MKAMILAAGMGTRLRPLTDDRPKALVIVGGRTLLEIALSRMRAFGVSEVIVNTHHHGDMVREYLRANNNFGMRIEVSPETNLLDTGGGLNQAAHFFLEDDGSCDESRSGDPFILHNVDVISNIDLNRMIRFHNDHAALATLAVQRRTTSRYLLFDTNGQLCGRRTNGSTDNDDSRSELVRPAHDVEPFAFCGVHVISTGIFAKVEREGAFSIIDAYLNLAEREEKIVAFGADEYYWRDLGTPQSVIAAGKEIASGIYTETH